MAIALSMMALACFRVGFSSWLIHALNCGNRFSAAAGIAGDPHTYYVGAASGGIYKTTDGGKNWITKRLPTGAIATVLLIDPIDPRIIYLGLSNPSR